MGDAHKKDPRYNSGSCLERTHKEEVIDRIENLVGSLTDPLYLALKKLTKNDLKELENLIISVKHPEGWA